jgi:hypothetical protein
VRHRTFKKGWLKGGTSDGWGFAFEVYPRERSINITFIHWYVIIERDYLDNDFDRFNEEKESIVK